MCMLVMKRELLCEDFLSGDRWVGTEEGKELGVRKPEQGTLGLHCYFAA